MLNRVDFTPFVHAPPPRRVAVVIGQLGMAGSEKQLYNFLAGCDRSRFSPVLYVSGQLGYWDERILALGIPIVLLRGSRPAKLWRFRRECLARGTDCFFSWSSYTNGYALALKGTGIPCIGSFRNALFADLPERHRWLWAWSSIAAVTTVVCNSRRTEADAALRCRRDARILYVPNVVQVFPQAELAAWRREWRESLGIADGQVLVLGVGRLSPQKNFTRFIDVVREVASRTPRIVAAIAGSDMGCGDALAARIAASGLDDRIRLLGRIDHAHRLMAAADIFLLTSDFEGTPNVVLEAMAAGVPCVSTRVDGVADLIEDGVTGLLAAQDTSELAAAVSHLAGSEPARRRIGSAARAAIEGYPRPSELIRRLWALCESAPTGQ